MLLAALHVRHRVLTSPIHFQNHQKHVQLCARSDVLARKVSTAMRRTDVPLHKTVATVPTNSSQRVEQPVQQLAAVNLKRVPGNVCVAASANRVLFGSTRAPQVPVFQVKNAHND